MPAFLLSCVSSFFQDTTVGNLQRCGRFVISSVHQIKFSQLVVDFSQRDSNLTVLYLFCKEIRTKFYIIETSIWLNHVEYIQSMFFSVCHWRKWHGHEKTAGALDTYCTGGNQSCASRASNILLTASFALFFNVLSSVWFASKPWKNCFHSKKNAHVQWKESGERIDILNLMRHGMFRFHSRALPLQSTIVADSG